MLQLVAEHLTFVWEGLFFPKQVAHLTGNPLETFRLFETRNAST